MSLMPAATSVLFCNLRDGRGELPLAAEVRHVSAAADARVLLDDDHAPYHVLVVRANGHMDEALTLLSFCRERHRGIVRFLICDGMSSSDAAAASDLVHQVMSLDCTERDLEAAVIRALKSERMIGDPVLREYVASLGHLPSLPGIISELNAVLASDVAGVKEVAEIIQRDAGMVTRILKLVNSAYFGLGQHNFFTLKEAVNLLGLRTVRDLAISAHLFDALPQAQNWRGFSFQQLQERSVVVSQFAAEIARRNGCSREQQGQARLAGLLVDVGMLVLALGDADKYHATMVRAQELKQPIYVVEKMQLGATHAQVGAYLLDNWNLSPEIVHAVLFHHTPTASADRGFTPLTAVHLADALLPPLFNAMGCNLGGRLSREYLRQVGQLDRLSEWEILAHDAARMGG